MGKVYETISFVFQILGPLLLAESNFMISNFGPYNEVQLVILSGSDLWIILKAFEV